jgi:hypothetical protein
MRPYCYRGGTRRLALSWLAVRLTGFDFLLSVSGQETTGGALIYLRSQRVAAARAVMDNDLMPPLVGKALRGNVDDGAS